jgi:hypothetical protein
VIRSSVARLALFVVGTAIFAVAYCQAPLYYSNQNQYFLHGLADAGVGDLHNDWLAGTRDSTPLFSALVTVTVRYLHPWVFYFDHALLLGVYGAAMLGLFVLIAGEAVAAWGWPIFLALFVIVHSALARWCSFHWLGDDYPWFFQGGLAGQYVLGGMFQPSMFGVLLIGTIYLFIRGKPLSAGLCAALAVVIHSTYLLPAGMLVLGMIAALVAERHVGQALVVGIVALVLVLPVIAYVLLTFGPTSTSTFAEAQAILVNERIPHHTRLDLWLTPVAVLQMLLVVLGIALARPVRLRYLFAVPSVLAVLLTLVQVASGSNTLALLFPWRVSSVLVPLATTVILSRLVSVLPMSIGRALPWAASVAAVAVCVAGGVWISVARLGFHTNDEELPLLAFARVSREKGQVYLLPVTVPKPDSARKSPLSSDFKPLEEMKQGDGIIPIDLQRFRLYTGVPIYVDFKSIPYKDTEVLEWSHRLHQAQAWQEQIRNGHLREILPELRDHGITHLVVPAGRDLEDDGVKRVHNDGTYQVYRLSMEPDAK